MPKKNVVDKKIRFRSLMVMLLTGRVQALVFALSWRIAKLSLQLSKNDACTLLQAGVLSFGADSFTLLILKLLLMF
jgi:hypothetical protein